MDPARIAILTRWFLYVLIGSIVLGASLGIIVVLAGNWSWFEVRVLLTTAAIAVGSLGGLACGAYLGTGRNRPLPIVGIGLAILATGLSIAGMWLEVNSTEYWKVTGSLIVVAIACAHVSLLSIARLADAFQWAPIFAAAVIFGVAGLLVLMINADHIEDWTYRVLAVGAILVAAVTILIPIFFVLSRRRPAAGSVPGELEPSLLEIQAEIDRLRLRIAELEGMRDQLPAPDPNGA